MKRNLLILALLACFGSIVFSSYEHGPAYEGGINRTGSNGGAASCAGSGCHDANTPTTVVAINVYNAAGLPVTQYTPGTTYTVAITGHHTTSLPLTEFGFQVSAVTGAGMQAGAFTVASGSGLRVTTLDELQIVEHKKALDDSITNYFVARFSWMAPATGAGNVQFYGILNPFGGEGDHDDDDDGRRKLVRYRMDDDDDDEEEESDTTCPNVAPVLLLTEGTGSATGVGGVTDDVEAKLYPNPCSNVLHISMQEPGIYEVSIYAVDGRRVYAQRIDQQATIPIAELCNGVYQVVLTQGNKHAVRSVIKQ